LDACDLGKGLSSISRQDDGSRILTAIIQVHKRAVPEVGTPQIDGTDVP
jgi:hypothetical protein